MNDDELDVEMLMFDLQRRIDATQLPGGRTVIKFLFRALPKFGHWWIVIEPDGTRVLCVHNPRVPVDIELVTDLRTMSHVWAGDMDIRMAKDTRPIGIEMESDFDPNNLVLAPLRIVRPYPPTIRPDQHQAISRANQKIGDTRNEEKVSREKRGPLREAIAPNAFGVSLASRSLGGGCSAEIRAPACHSARFRHTFYCQLLEPLVVPERIEHRIEPE